MSSVRRRVAFILITGALLAGCATGPPMVQEPVVGIESATRDELLELPQPAQKIVVAVYAFEDETGQFEFSDTVQTLSRAVTQGATSILIEALLEAGNGSWFTVLEREGIDNLLRERQIIRETRALYQGGGDLSRNYVAPLLFAGMMLEGGIIGFDTNTLTGGLGARLLGIGGSTKFRQDTVTVYLRAISTQSGEVLESVNVSKTIFSVALSADVFRFVSSDEILEIDTGVTTNEPEHFAVKQAIEKAVIALVLNGAQRERWAFADPAAAAALFAEAPAPPATGPAPAGVEPAPPAAAPEPAGRATTQGSGTSAPQPAATPSDAPPSASPPATTKLADSRAPERAAPVADATRTTRPAPASVTRFRTDGAMANQALGILIAESGGSARPAASSSGERQGGSGLRKVGEPEIIPLPPQEPDAPAGTPHRVAEPERPSSKAPRALTPSQAMLARLAAHEPHPEPRMEEP